MKKYGYFIAYTLVIVLVSAALSSLGTALFLSQQRVADDNHLAISRDDYEMLTRYSRLEKVRQYVKAQHLEEIDEQTLLDYAAKGLAAGAGDIYTYYLTPEETAVANESQEGVYRGIGCQLIVDPRDGLITITRVFKDSPAEEGGIIPGDKIIEVFGEIYTGQYINEAVAKMRGEPGTQAEITILRGEERLDYVLERAEVTNNRVEVRMLEDGIGVITIYEFFGDVVQGFKDAIKTLEKEKAKGMIIDVRGNPGGSLEACLQICDLLLPEVVIVSTRDRFDNVEAYTSDAAMVSMPIVVLVNDMSASASEILAGALKDHDVATIVGTQTFGKGLVQMVYTFKEDNASLHLTVQEYTTPSGENIHGVGITPDRVADLTEELKSNPAAVTDDNDTQLQAGIEELKKLMGVAEE